jgi:hypothetical protein
MDIRNQQFITITPWKTARPFISTKSSWQVVL